MAGKPYRRSTTKRCARRNGRRPTARPARILAIGDSVRTDAIGAAKFGLDLLFITGSIHAGDSTPSASPTRRRSPIWWRPAAPGSPASCRALPGKAFLP